MTPSLEQSILNLQRIRIEQLKLILRMIAEDQVKGGEGKRGKGQPFYQDKLKNVQHLAKSAIELI